MAKTPPYRDVTNRDILHSRQLLAKLKMKVTELRNWLSDFGDKNKQHYHRNNRTRQGKATRSQRAAFNSKGAGKETCTAATQDARPTDMPSTRAEASIPLATHGGTAGAVPTSSSERHPPSNCFGDFHVDDLEMNPSADYTMSTQDETSATDEFHDAFPESSDSSFDRDDPQEYAHLNCGGIEGLEGMGHEHFSLLERQRPSLCNAFTNEEEVDDLAAFNVVDSEQQSTNIFENKTLTAGTLEFICNGKNLQVNANSSEDGTDSSQSSGSSKPSIAPGAMESKMARLFLGDADSSSTEKGPSDDNSKQPSVEPPRRVLRKKVDPKDLGFLQVKPCPAKSHGMVEPGPRSSVVYGIRKFGGPKKKTVEKRKEELERLWAENKSATYVKKVKWEVCRRTGKFKKKVVVDVEK